MLNYLIKILYLLIGYDIKLLVVEEYNNRCFKYSSVYLKHSVKIIKKRWKIKLIIYNTFPSVILSGLISYMSSRSQTGPR